MWLKGDTNKMHIMNLGLRCNWVNLTPREGKMLSTHLIQTLFMKSPLLYSVCLVLYNVYAY